MFRIIHQLFEKYKDDGKDADNITVPVRFRKKPLSVTVYNRKETYTTWECRACGNSYFYKTIRCPACESDKVQEIQEAAPAFDGLPIIAIVTFGGTLVILLDMLQYRTANMRNSHRRSNG